MKRIGIVILLFVNIFCFGQKVPVIKLPQLQQRYLTNNDTLYLINFWATWCGPCVKELPEFEKINAVFKEKKFKMILVSLDFKKDLNKLEKFIVNKKISAEVVLLDETKYNEWIDKIDPSWGGAIPATLLIKNVPGYSLFHEKPLTFDELNTLVTSQLNP